MPHLSNTIQSEGRLSFQDVRSVNMETETNVFYTRPTRLVCEGMTERKTDADLSVV